MRLDWGSKPCETRVCNLISISIPHILPEMRDVHSAHHEENKSQIALLPRLKLIYAVLLRESSQNLQLGPPDEVPDERPWACRTPAATDSTASRKFHICCCVHGSHKRSFRRRRNAQSIRRTYGSEYPSGCNLVRCAYRKPFSASLSTTAPSVARICFANAPRSQKNLLLIRHNESRLWGACPKEG